MFRASHSPAKTPESGPQSEKHDGSTAKENVHGFKKEQEKIQ
jgi:hypothetical protein